MVEEASVGERGTSVAPGQGRSWVRLASGLAVVLAAASCRGSGRDDPLVAHGSVEARQVRVASRIGGRVLQVLVDEDDRVEPGQPLVEIDVAELEAQRAQARAAVDEAAARERLLVRGAQREDVVAARKALESARIRVDAARRDLRRAEQLHAGEAAPDQSVEDARAAVDLARSEAAARLAQLQKVVGGARAEELAAAAAARARAEGALAAVEDRLRDRVLEAPLAGTVLHRLVEPGEVARSAAPLLVIGDLAHPYLDVYVPEPRVAEAAVGAPVEVRADALPTRLLRGTVTHVASEAEFTPKNVQTAEQRARLVFRVRIDVEDPEGLLHPGMPARAVFSGGPRSPDGGAPAADGRRKS